MKKLSTFPSTARFVFVRERKTARQSSSLGAGEKVRLNLLTRVLISVSKLKCESSGESRRRQRTKFDAVRVKRRGGTEGKKRPALQIGIGEHDYLSHSRAFSCRVLKSLLMFLNALVDKYTFKAQKAFKASSPKESFKV